MGKYFKNVRKKIKKRGGRGKNKQNQEETPKKYPPSGKTFIFLRQGGGDNTIQMHNIFAINFSFPDKIFLHFVL